MHRSLVLALLMVSLGCQKKAPPTEPVETESEKSAKAAQKATEERLEKDKAALKSAKKELETLSARLAAAKTALAGGVAKIAPCRPAPSAPSDADAVMTSDDGLLESAAKRTTNFGSLGEWRSGLISTVLEEALKPSLQQPNGYIKEEVHAVLAAAKKANARAHLVVVSVTSMVEPEVTAADKFRGGSARATAVLFHDDKAVCRVEVAAANGKTVDFLTVGGAGALTEGRLINDLERKLRAAAAEKLKSLKQITDVDERK